jgi:ADP-ribosyltransferase exoenzyme
MQPKVDTPEKKLSFKEYRRHKNKIEVMETSFGSHSLPKKPDSMSTSFGKHSEKKEPIQEKISLVPKDSPNSLPRITAAENSHIHEKVAPIGKLSVDQKEAVHDYSDSSRAINDMLHKHNSGYDISTSRSAAYKDTAKHLDAALDKHKTSEDMHVYTGLKHSPSKHFKKVNGKVPDKAIVHLPAYTSTSSSFHSAREFAENTMHQNDERHNIDYEDGDHGDGFTARHVLKLHVPNGSHAMSLMKHSFDPAEKEILLHRGHHIEVDSKPTKTDKNTYVWNAKVVAHKPNDLEKPIE